MLGTGRRKGYTTVFLFGALVASNFMWAVVHYHVADVKDHSPPKGLPVAPVWDYTPWDDDKYKDIQDPEIMEEREWKHDHTKTDDYYGGGKVKGDGTEPMDGVGDDAIRIIMEQNGVVGDTDEKGGEVPHTDPEEEDDDAATDDANGGDPGEDAEDDEEANVGESEDDAEEEDHGDDDGEK
mmetsp:Transcript_15438/g.30738  ORF Transcript_15438/g.30738 Transcript_15438/m.30738 type:complete len:181 (-) Transcript_15438:439-981(-)|eukprot:CAMPEP_0194317868 /NCGR_PEP_ID=MMETSP0171-20130528/14561_1 /TAXON_ID=218684 /ORGANISM="Corethron pennatum, Strain L29A3" /LENGTH=180 /DNA_ID=CAMNT_0039074595 /DNA_START=268 /DNA_END=810 /DNA_ORIENTATION=-